MQIILLILKIIGIILLVILALLVLLLLAVLFIPVKYEAKGSYLEEKPYLRLKISYAFPIVWVIAMYCDKVGTAYIRVLGIKVKDFLAPKKEKKAKKSKTAKSDAKKDSHAAAGRALSEKDAKAEKNDDAGVIAENHTAHDNTTDQIALANEQQKENTVLTAEDAAEDMAQKKSIADKIKELWERVCRLITSCIEKVRQLLDKIRQTKNDAAQKKELLLHYIEWCQTKEVQTAFGTGKKTILKLLKSIAPKKLKISLKIGTGDPATTGQICGFYGMLYPFIAKHVIMEPDFEKNIYEGQFEIRGRIYGFSLVKAGLVFLFHKDLKCIRDLILKK